MVKKYIVALTEDERQELEELTTTGKHAVSRIGSPLYVGYASAMLAIAIHKHSSN